MGPKGLNQDDLYTLIFLVMDYGMILEQKIVMPLNSSKSVNICCKSGKRDFLFSMFDICIII
jgi:hypothetical protein